MVPMSSLQADITVYKESYSERREREKADEDYLNYFNNTLIIKILVVYRCFFNTYVKVKRLVFNKLFCLVKKENSFNLAISDQPAAIIISNNFLHF